MSKTEDNKPEKEQGDVSLTPATSEESANATESEKKTSDQAEHDAQAEHTEPKNSEPKKAWYKRIRWWGWVLIAIFAVIIGFFGTLGTQALMVKNHEEKAIAVVKDTVKGGNLSNMSNAIAQMQENTKQANAITHNGLWNFVASWPGVGSNIRVAQDLTQIVDDVAAQNVPEYVNIATKLTDTKLISGSSINIKPVVEELPAFVKANDSLEKQLNRINEIPDPSLGVVRNLLGQAKGAVNSVSGLLNQAEEIGKKLPTYLGYESKQTYAVMAMTPAEVRMSGGLIGAIGTLTLENGKFTIGDFEPNDAYIKYGRATVPQDTVRLFMEDGPLYMTYDVRDLANFPDTSTVADTFRTVWVQTPWGAKTELNGIIMVDPVVVQAIVKVTGDIKLPDGKVLNGNNTAEFLMNTVYKDYKPEDTNEYFSMVAKSCVSSLMTKIDMKTIASLAKTLQTLARERHMAIYTYHPELEQILSNAGFSASIPTSTTNPAVGIYTTQENPSKMGWYLKHTTKITQTCTDSAPDKYHVEYTVDNTLPEDEVGKISWYITGTLAYNEGSSMEMIFFYPPFGGRISNFKVDGTANASTPVMDTFNGAVMYRSLAQIRPEQKITYSFDVETSKHATSRLTIDQSPQTTEDTGVQYMNSCPAN